MNWIVLTLPQAHDLHWDIGTSYRNSLFQNLKRMYRKKNLYAGVNVLPLDAGKSIAPLHHWTFTNKLCINGCTRFFSCSEVQNMLKIELSDQSWSLRKSPAPIPPLNIHSLPHNPHRVSLFHSSQPHFFDRWHVQDACFKIDLWSTICAYEWKAHTEANNNVSLCGQPFLSPLFWEGISPEKGVLVCVY